MSFPSVDDVVQELAPPKSDTTTARQEQRIANTGTTEATVTTLLAIGAMAILRNGATPIRYVFSAATGLSTQVATTNKVLGPYAEHKWRVESTTCAPYAEAADGVSAYECWTWQASA